MSGETAEPHAMELPRGAQALLDAVIAMSSDLDMHNVLDRIVMSSCELTGAQYGALGVIGADGQLSDFIAHGIDPHVREQIGELPRGRGILRLLIDHPEPIRLPKLQDHAESYGFPPNHPPMTTFLGVPVRIRGTVFGNLYLTEKAGGTPFTEQDETLVQALASAAGFVIENARAYALSERQRTWLEASSRLNDALQPPIEIAEALQHVVVGTRAVSGARAVGVFRVDDSGAPALLAADGRFAAQLPALAEQLADQIREVELGGEPAAVPGERNRTVLVLPLRTHLFGTAVLLVELDTQPSMPGLPAKEHELITSFADQASLTLDRVQALADREELAIVSDRDRIARDLHDLVIQRLFATGLQLQGIRTKAAIPAVQARLDQAVDDLDTTIRDIRSTIFELQHRDQATLRDEIQALVREYAPVLGFAPAVRTRGPVDLAVPEDIGSQLLAVLREALSNVARHAGASAASVEIEADGVTVLLRVTDDGCGLPVNPHESGLRNVRRRAAELQGAMRLSLADPHGAVLEWEVPLPPAGG
jgi:signal transduction histidine kinase